MHLAYNNELNEKLQLLLVGRKCDTFVFYNNNITINKVLGRLSFICIGVKREFSKGFPYHPRSKPVRSYAR